jgi:gamma-glutamylputrescine oxidase
VVIVGGGMAGLMCAHALAKEGKSVILLEKYFCGAGASGKSSGFISPDSELELSDLIKNLGKDKAKQLWDFNLEGIRRIKGLIRDYHIECDYQDQDCCYIASSKGDIKNIQREHDAREQLGHTSKIYNRQTLPSVLGSRAFFGGVQYTDTYGINGFRFCQELAKELERMGCLFLNNQQLLR